jgi:hypothetical protein
VRTPAPANQSKARVVTGAKPRAIPMASQMPPAMAVVTSSDVNAPLSSTSGRLPRAMATPEPANAMAEAIANASPVASAINDPGIQRFTRRQ